jgi:hypothetical protein
MRIMSGVRAFRDIMIGLALLFLLVIFMIPDGRNLEGSVRSGCGMPTLALGTWNGSSWPKAGLRTSCSTPQSGQCLIAA